MPRPRSGAGEAKCRLAIPGSSECLDPPHGAAGGPPGPTPAVLTAREPVISRSRSKVATTARHMAMSMTSNPSPNPTAVQTPRGTTWNDTRAVTARGGRLASVPSCCATRTSLDRAEIAVPTPIDQKASSGANSAWARMCEPSVRVAATVGLAAKKWARITARANRM